MSYVHGIRVTVPAELEARLSSRRALRKRRLTLLELTDRIRRSNRGSLLQGGYCLAMFLVLWSRGY